MKETLSTRQVKSILEGVVERMANTSHPSPDGEPMENRLDRLVAHLVEHGYMASWELQTEGFVLLASNCPYAGVSEKHPEMCSVDLSFISMMLGMTPKRLTHQAEGDTQCSFLITFPK